MAVEVTDPDRPVVRTKPVSRDKLAQFLPSQELIVAFENLAADVGLTLPDATVVNADLLSQVVTQAQVATDIAAGARSGVDRLANALMALATALQTQRSERAAISDLRRQVDEIRTILLGS
jgi:hypothetical protein